MKSEELLDSMVDPSYLLERNNEALLGYPQAFHFISLHVSTLKTL
jgi:hypothetical protein